MGFLFWLFMTPTGWTAFFAYLALTGFLMMRPPKRRRPDPFIAFHNELALIRRDLRAVRDVRNN